MLRKERICDSGKGIKLVPHPELLLEFHRKSREILQGNDHDLTQLDFQ